MWPSRARLMVRCLSRVLFWNNYLQNHKDIRMACLLFHDGPGSWWYTKELRFDAEALLVRVQSIRDLRVVLYDDNGRWNTVCMKGGTGESAPWGDLSNKPHGDASSETPPPSICFVFGVMQDKEKEKHGACLLRFDTWLRHAKYNLSDKKFAWMMKG